ncbi:MAG: hypothetical protein C4K58_01170 [Flavobacteriaceae bacterium]|nr:MAG: hypothetical protein C4K58_01170 [Flavobacteriaceae bacterium]
MLHQKTYVVPKIETEENLQRLVLPIDQLNWPQFDYKPNAKVSLWYSTLSLCLFFEVEENHLLTTTQEISASVCQDSCVEFFMSLDRGKSYYNFEFNATGTLYMAYRQSQNRKQKCLFLVEEILEVKTAPSLLKYSLVNQKGKNIPWSLQVEIPFSFFGGIEKFSQGFSANFYKCADKADQRHYLTSFPIDGACPDFHRPDCFASFTLEMTQ